MRDFRKLRVWEEAIDLSVLIYELVKRLPETERFGLKSQMERCSVSIASNIAEGCSRRTSANFAHFLDIALGSAFELETQLMICQRLDYMPFENFDKVKGRIVRLEKQMNALRSKVLIKQNT